MSPAEDRDYHLERAAQCRRMADESTDPVVRRLHEELAQFHEAEAGREDDFADEDEDEGQRAL